MIFNGVTGFNWDEGNSSKNYSKHTVTMLEAEEIFFNTPRIVAIDQGHSINENRFHLLGITNRGRHLHATFTIREVGETRLVRVISIRNMSKKERGIYENER